MFDLSTIKTKEWLISKRKEMELTQKDVAIRAKLSLPAIEKIERGERLGSAETRNKIINVLSDDDAKISIDSEYQLDDIQKDIDLYGENQKCFVFYKYDNNNIIFIDYAFDEELKLMNLKIYLNFLKLKYH